MDTDTTSSSPIVAPSMATMATTQLILYARDMKYLFDRERQKTRALSVAYQDLQALAADLKTVYAAEQHKSRELEHAYADIIRRLTRAVRFKDEETGAHVRRLRHYARTLASISA